MKEPSKEQIKERTKHLRQALKEKHNIDLPQGHALEVMAKVFGYQDWNTASAMSSNSIVQPQPIAALLEVHSKELPSALKLQNAGDYVAFFSKFRKEEKVFFNEYKEGELGHFGTITSICSATYDSEIQDATCIRLELNTEDEKTFQLDQFGKSARQSFESTKAGRYQRVIKWFRMKSSFWNRDDNSNSKNQ